MSTKAEFQGELHLPTGGWLDYWTKNASTVKQFIAVNKLQPLALAAPDLSGRAAGAKAGKAVRLVDLGIRGGMMAAHLHFENEVYLLNSQQWTAFSAKVLKASKTALASAKSVSFGAAMNLQVVLESVPSK